MELKLNTIPPAPPVEEQNIEENTLSGISENQTTQTIPDQVQPPIEPLKEETPQADTFIENLNKRFGTQFKADDEVKGIFDLPKRVNEYESKLKDAEVQKKSIEDYKKRIEELEGDQDPLKYFSSPDTYIAEQLRIKYPKSNPVLLQEIATSNVDTMNDFDVLVKEKQLFVVNPPKESSIRAIILKKYGIDAETNPEEWDELAKAEMQIDAASARDKINTLKSAIELPKVMTREERQKAEQEAQLKREQAATPLKQTFSKFDKFSHADIQGFDFDVPDEFKNKLPDMAEAMLINAGMEPTEDNLKSMYELRDALFVHQYLPKLREIWIKEGETKAKADLDAQLHNTQPPNTTTMTDHEQGEVLPGLNKFLSDQKLK
jgi:hypothetical protein